MSAEHDAVSRDGTRIAFERLGPGAEAGGAGARGAEAGAGAAGTPVILISGALQGRASMRPTAQALARHLPVLIYDRRGRGESGDTAPYAVEREIEDLGTVIAAAGGAASVYGHSSGAAVALHAAARGLPIAKLVLHEPPFGSGSEEERRAEQAEAEQIAALLAEDRRGDAVRFFLASMGLPPEILDQLAGDSEMLANAPTLLYEYELLSDRSRGGLTPAQQASTVTAPALVLAGGAGPEWMLAAGRQIADALPRGRLRILEGQEHAVPPEVLAPAVAEFLAG